MIGQIKKVSNFYSIKFLIYLFMCFVLFINICLAAENTKWLKINKAGMSAFKERDFINSEKLYIEAIYEARKNNLVAELSATLNNLGLLKIELFQYKESEILFNESLKIRLAYYGLNHRYVAQSYNNLARLYESSDRYNESIDFYIKAINIYEILGNSSALTNDTYNKDDNYSLGIHLVKDHNMSNKSDFNDNYIVFLLDTCSPATLEVQEHKFIQSLRSIRPHGLNSVDPFGIPLL